MFRTDALIVTLGIFATGANIVLAASQPTNCFVDFAVYGPSGERLPFSATSVTPQGKAGDIRFDILRRNVDGFRAAAKGSRVLFGSERILGRFIEVTLEGPDKSRLVSKLVITDCHMRKSLYWGHSDIGLDVNGVELAGRLVGCQFTGDWWVRAAPMFGGWDGDPAFDGYIESDGSFRLTVGPYGVRHMVVIGKGNLPVKVIGIDVVLGKRADVGNVDLTGLCSQ